MVWLLVARSNLCLGVEDDRQVWRVQRVGLQLSKGMQEEEVKRRRDGRIWRGHADDMCPDLVPAGGLPYDDRTHYAVSPRRTSSQVMNRYVGTMDNARRL